MLSTGNTLTGHWDLLKSIPIGKTKDVCCLNLSAIQRDACVLETRFVVHRDNKEFVRMNGKCVMYVTSY